MRVVIITEKDGTMQICKKWIGDLEVGMWNRHETPPAWNAFTVWMIWSWIGLWLLLDTPTGYISMNETTSESCNTKSKKNWRSVSDLTLMPHMMDDVRYAIQEDTVGRRRWPSPSLGAHTFRSPPHTAPHARPNRRRGFQKGGSRKPRWRRAGGRFAYGSA